MSSRHVTVLEGKGHLGSHNSPLYPWSMGLVCRSTQECCQRNALTQCSQPSWRPGRDLLHRCIKVGLREWKRLNSSQRIMAACLWDRTRSSDATRTSLGSLWSNASFGIYRLPSLSVCAQKVPLVSTKFPLQDGWRLVGWSVHLPLRKSYLLHH